MLVIVQMRKKGKIGTHVYFFFFKKTCAALLFSKKPIAFARFYNITLNRRCFLILV